MFYWQSQLFFRSLGSTNNRAEKLRNIFLHVFNKQETSGIKHCNYKRNWIPTTVHTIRLFVRPFIYVCDNTPSDVQRGV